MNQKIKMSIASAAMVLGSMGMAGAAGAISPGASCGSAAYNVQGTTNVVATLTNQTQSPCYARAVASCKKLYVSGTKYAYGSWKGLNSTSTANCQIANGNGYTVSGTGGYQLGQ